MPTTLVYKTPIWKEIIAVIIAGLFIAVGVLSLYVAYTQGELKGYVIGLLALPFGIVTAVLSLSSRTVLRLDTEGVFVQPHFFSRRTIPWSDIERFEKSVQTFSQKDRFGSSEHKIQYLGIYLKQPTGAGTTFEAAHTVFQAIDAKNAKDPLIAQQGMGHIFLAGLQLPGNLDKVLAEVREYHKQIAGDSVHYDPAEVLPSTKGSFKPSLYMIVLGIAIAAFLLLALASFITGMTPEQLLNSMSL